ncbi:vacuolar protein sorting protein VPS45 [Acrasis kona]|uniref:Vacuolar protein sorting protein VPS45 n=1 Tax=Acrasis kona TaxID=1008807 RepID=A0AAW2YIQ1_9EUKA
MSKGKQAAVPSMDAISGIRGYITGMIESVKGVKVLLVDESTKEIISVTYSQSDIMKSEVFLVDNLDSDKRERMPNVKCIVFVRPTKENVNRLKHELEDPKYQAYSIFFSNQISSDDLDRIAASDKRESVQHVYTFYADFIAIDRQLFVVPTKVTGLLKNNWNSPSLDRIIEGLTSVLCAMKKKPVIRFQSHSEVCKRIAAELRTGIDEKVDLFSSKHFRTSQAPLMLIIDRRNDPVTPLLTQWTYQAMLHELVGINNNRVRVTPKEQKKDENEAGGSKETQKEVVVSSQDSFYVDNQFSNWGDLCENIKKMMEEYSAKHSVKENINSIDDIAKFMSQYPQFRKFATEVSKHVALVSDLRSKIVARHLMDVSELEQDLVCGDDHNSFLKRLRELILSGKTTNEDALRLVLLYTIRYEGNGKEISSLKQLLKDKGAKDTSLIDSILRYGGRSQQDQNLFNASSGDDQGVLHSLVATIAKGFVDKEVKNVFTQHKPVLHNILDKLFKNKLNENTFPFMGQSDRSVPREVIVFIVGGVTYEEALTVHLFNTQQQQQQGNLNPNQGTSQSGAQKSVILGGTKVLNSTRFIRDLRELNRDDEDDDLL